MYFLSHLSHIYLFYWITCPLLFCGYFLYTPHLCFYINLYFILFHKITCPRCSSRHWTPPIFPHPSLSRNIHISVFYFSYPPIFIYQWNSLLLHVPPMFVIISIYSMPRFFWCTSFCALFVVTNNSPIFPCLYILYTIHFLKLPVLAAAPDIFIF